jgi:hypothetical protein
MSARQPLPDELMERPFNVREARARGVTGDRLRSSDLLAPFWSTRAHWTLDAHLGMRCAALQTVLPESAAFVGPTAAVIWGLPLPRRLEGDPRLHVGSAAPHRATRHQGTVGSRRPAGSALVIRDGIRVLDRVDTWASLAAHLTVPDLTAVADALLGPTSGYDPADTRVRMRAVMDRSGSARGIRAMRRSFELAREGVRSRTETHLRLLLRDIGPGEPHVAVPVRVASGRQLHPDLSWPEFKVGVEYDGAVHRDADQHEVDVARHEELVDAGWTLVHVVARDLYRRPSAVVARVIRRLRAAGWSERRAEVTRFGRFEL